MSYKAYLFDLDGTIYRGDEVIPHAPETLAELRTAIESSGTDDGQQ